jgi:hypothetical protein
MHSSAKFACINIVLLVCCSWANGQKPEKVSVLSPRPVRDVVLQWEKQYGWVITYEDPRFEYATDLEDVTEKVRRDLKPGEAIEPSKRIIGAHEQQLSVTYNAPKTANDAAARLQAANQLVDAFAKIAGNTFSVQQTDTRIHLLPGLVRDSSGQLQPSRPILDTVISVPAQDRNGTEFLHALCETLTGATAHSIFVGTIPFNSMTQFRTNAGYENLPARQILEDFLNRMPNGERYTWALLFQKDYALNIHLVRDISKPVEASPRTSSSPRKFDEMHSAVEGTKTVYVRR